MPTQLKVRFAEGRPAPPVSKKTAGGLEKSNGEASRSDERKRTRTAAPAFGRAGLMKAEPLVAFESRARFESVGTELST